jgi:mannosylglycerate hydrolase
MNQVPDNVCAHGHFIPNTHLDREWTMDFQHTRKLTVDFLNKLLEMMEQIPEYTFLLDSQAVPLEDYLEVMPENRGKIRELIQAGRINAGPWYSALDMNCLTGESIVRNMLWGHVVVEDFGPVMKVGYTPFGWGQISQLPQIYRGFGIEVAFFYRGVTIKEAPQAEFVWEGSDGSELLTSRFGTGARYNFYFDVWRRAFYSELPHRLRRRFHWGEDAAPFKLFNDVNRYDHGSVFKVERPIRTEKLKEAFRNLLQREKEHFGAGEIAFMHGMDTSTPDLREETVTRECQKYLGDGESLFYSSLPRYAAAIKEKTQGKELARIKGEVRHLKLNDYGFSYIANDIISARSRQKAYMAQVESMLIRQAEPFAAMALFARKPWPGKYLDIGWKQFLKCHPHDTVGGCGIDRLEEDSMYRLRDTMSIANLVSSDSLMAVQGCIDTESLGDEGIVLTVFNPSLVGRTGVVKAYVDVARELKFSRFSMCDYAGKDIEFTCAPTGCYGKVFRDHSDLALMSYADEFCIHFEAADVPALGYKVFFLKRGEQSSVASVPPKGFTLENEFIRVQVNSDGTVDLFKKETGESFPGLNYFEDDGEVGHSWSHVKPANDLEIRSRGGKAELSWKMSSKVISTIKAKFSLQVPATTPLSANRLDWRQTTRKAENLRELPIEVDYTLCKGERSLEVNVSVDNQSRNHRLRAMFPTNIMAKSSYAESPFDVVQRAIARDSENPYRHFPYLTFPMVRFAGIVSGTSNFTLLSGGLKEYEIVNDDARTFALTIFRGYENNLCTSGDFDLEYRPGELGGVKFLL